jgi:hypothetical protein
MANKNRLSFMKKLKERARKEEAAEKMARRQGKTDKLTGSEQYAMEPATDHTIS